MEILHYIANNLTAILALITAIGALISVLVGIFQYIDLRNREEKRKNYENFMKITDKLGAMTGSDIRENEKVSIIELVITIYQLQNLKEYSNTIMPILSFLKECSSAIEKTFGEKMVKNYNEAIDYVIKELSAV